jgi:putative ABC transport system permease protein
MGTLNNLGQDLHYAVRTIRRNWGFGLAAVMILALGIGANTIIFSIIDATLLKPLPYSNPDRLVALHGVFQNGGRQFFSAADFLDYRRQTAFCEQLAAYRQAPFNSAGHGDRPERLNGTVTTENFFETLGVNARIGRTFNSGTDNPGVRLAILSYALWQQHGGSQAAVGSTIDLDGEPLTIIGVMPPSFQFPNGTDLWMLSRYEAPEDPYRPKENPSAVRDHYYLNVIGRLRPSEELGRARTEASATAARLKQQFGADDAMTNVAVLSLRDELVGQTRPVLNMLLGAVALLLIITCTNVANIVLARTSNRQQEIAIRGALGAHKTRILQQLISENTLLAIGGGLVGCILAYFSLQPLQSLVSASALNGNPLQLDTRALIFTACIAFCSTFIFGLLPALRFAKPDLRNVLNESGRGSSGGRRASRTRTALVVVQIALAFVLLSGAGLLIRSLNSLLKVPLGFNPSNVLSLQVSFPTARYTPEGRNIFVTRVLNDIPHLPGVNSAAAISRLPLGQGVTTRQIDIKGRPESSADINPDYLTATPDYFQTMGIRLVAGRTFTDHDIATAPGVVIVNQALAQHFWPGENPIGKGVQIGNCIGWCEVVGVVGDVLQHQLDQAPPPTVYRPYAQDPWPFLSLVVRTANNPANLASAVEGTIHSVDKEEPVYSVLPMSEVLSASLESRRTRTLLVAVFGTLALLLAFAGIAGVTAYSVALRTHEIGIRMAMGADRKNVLRLVLGQALGLAGIGIVAGACISLGTLRVFANLLYGVQSYDVNTLLAVSVLLAITSVLASCFPAWRAISINPIEALRPQ